MAETPREYDPLVDELPSRYVVGIDLGTTNSAVTYVDTEEDPWQVRVFPVTQLVAPGEIEKRETLPSFHYEAATGELAEDALRLPWTKEVSNHAVGVMARDEGAKTPGRLIASAKSWLCHTGVNRRADLLPWQGAGDIQRLSPVEASARYLNHVRHAWNHQFPQHPLSEQDVVITLPASFDEVARELTIDAAKQAELPRVTLIEEPQAAFYAWVHKHRDNWSGLVDAGQTILVCDVGGGTSDFTLIRARHASDAADGEANVQFHRVAVGDHLILGGDNLDLALATHIEQKINSKKKLQPNQWDVLVRNCRRIKEMMLEESAPESTTVNLPGSGSKLIGGSLKAEVTRDEVQQLLIEGFLPYNQLTEKPQRRQSGFQEFGLPYATDSGITRYLGAFLTTHREALRELDGETNGDPARPDILLFNGGFFASPLLRQRLVSVIKSWFADEDANWEPVLLENERLDLAVAIGAAYYGMVRRGDGVRITANLARTYYVGIETDEHAATGVCLVPGSAEPGQDFAVTDRTFELAVSEPVEFPLYVSSTRLIDQPGDLVPFDEEQMRVLPPIRTVLRTERRNQTGFLPVQLHGRLTEIGTLDLWCRDTEQDRRWRLQFDVRTATQTDVSAHENAAEEAGFVEETSWEEGRSVLDEVFGPGGKGKPDGVMKRLREPFGRDRAQWPPSLLRRIWETLMELEAGRRRSATHEARWLNLLGYGLRPGYGFAVDDYRVVETWRTLHGKFAHFNPTIQNEALILWRRIAGGLTAEQQQAVSEQMVARIRRLHQHYASQKKKHGQPVMKPQETVEVWRLLGSLELLPVRVKIDIGNLLLDLLTKPKLAPSFAAMVWAIGRLGQRVPVYGPLNTVVPRDRVNTWLDKLLALDIDEPGLGLAVMQMSRRTDDRYRDLTDKQRAQVVHWLTEQDVSERLLRLVTDGGELDHREQGQIVGEALPKGLRLR